MATVALDLNAAYRIRRAAYEAIDDRAAWDRVVQDLVRTLGASAGGIHFRERLVSPGGRATERASQIWTGLPPEFEGAYLANYWPEDPWAPAVAAAPQGEALLPDQLIPTRKLVRSRFYNELCRPFDFHELLASSVVNEPDGLVAGAGFFRPVGARPFGEAERAFLALLAPHLAHVTHVATRVARGAPTALPRSAADGAGGGAHPLDGLPVGAFVVDVTGRVLRSNPVAARIIAAQDGLWVDPEGLRASREVDTRALRAAIHRATSAVGEPPGASTTSGTGGLIVQRPSGRVPLTITVSPLRPGTWRASETPGAAALIYVIDPTLEIESSGALLKRLFGLTEAEARIARLVGSGQSPREASDELGIAWNTARYQLRQVFAKTGVDRQSALVRLMLLLRIATAD